MEPRQELDFGLEEVAAEAAGELRALAAAYMRGERASHTLHPTALVHEAWIRLTQGDVRAFESRAAFLRYASQAMRHILVDHARRRGAAKRGGGTLRRLGAADPALPDGRGPTPEQVLALHEALSRLEVEHPRAARVVELRFFGGASFPEIASVLGLGLRTVEKDWAAARAWLRGMLDGH